MGDNAISRVEAALAARTAYNKDAPFTVAADTLRELLLLARGNRDVLDGGTISLTSFDGHCIRIDFATREEAEQALDRLSPNLERGERP